MASARFYPYAQTINGTTYSGIRGYSINPNTSKSVMGHDGSVDPTHACVLDQNAAISTRTVDIANVLAAVGLDGLAITELTTFFRNGEDCGLRDTGDTHVKTVATSGCIVMRPLRASDNQVVEAEVEAFLKSSNGLTDPLTISFDQALTGAISEVAHYTLGPVFVTPDGGERTRITVSEWEYDPGINIDSDTNDGVPYPTYIGIDSREPKASLTTPDIRHVQTINLAGKTGSMELFLRKLSEDGLRVSEATAEHIKITIPDAHMTTDAMNAEQEGRGSASTMADATYNGSNAISTLSFGVAIA